MAAHHAANDTANNLRNYTTPRDSYWGVSDMTLRSRSGGTPRETDWSLRPLNLRDVA
jgi:hypothetical protein